jgi:glucose/mannose-6-phosphate isomerase
MPDRSPAFADLRGRLDSKGMFGLVGAFPAHMADAWERGKQFCSALERTRVARVVVCGMGGSAIGADMVRSYLGNGLSVPIHVNRSYDVPTALRRDAFFVFSSYSGNTAETLAAYDRVRSGRHPCAAITVGGELGARCGRDGIPVCGIPSGMPPRAAIAYLFFPLLHILSVLGAAETDEAEFGRAVGALEARCREYSAEEGASEAHRIAVSLTGKIPFVFSRGGLFDAVARRWSCQFSENAKTLAHFAVFPEPNHNEIMGWQERAPWHERIVAVSLEDEEDHPSAVKQAEIALGIMGALSGGVVRVGSTPGGRLERILSAMILGDFASVYLAYLNGVDPTPISVIDYLKDRLRETTG